MEKQLFTESEILIDSQPIKVWNSLIDPQIIEKFMMGLRAVSTWKLGSEISWFGRHSGEDEDQAHGIIKELVEGQSLIFTFFYKGYNYPDDPQFYTIIHYQLKAMDGKTLLTVTQGDFNVFEKGETFCEHSQSFWDQALILLNDIHVKNEN